MRSRPSGIGEIDVHPGSVLGWCRGVEHRNHRSGARSCFSVLLSKVPREEPIRYDFTLYP